VDLKESVVVLYLAANKRRLNEQSQQLRGFERAGGGALLSCT